MKSASASWFDLERPGEHVIQSLDIEEFLWWNAVQEKHRAWQEALHHHLEKDGQMIDEKCYFHTFVVTMEVLSVIIHLRHFLRQDK